MKKLTLLSISACILTLLSTKEMSAQCDSTAHYAHKYLSEQFIPDGQSYRALLFEDQIAEFHTTFYGGARYRIVAFSGTEKQQLIFSLYDELDNILFTNEEFSNAPYWDFEFKSTTAARIEARLDLMKQTSGCSVLLIGFER